MENIDQLKKNWATALAHLGPFDETAMRKLIRSRINKHTRQAYHYFWASLVTQIIMYALLTHVIVKFWGQPAIQLPSLGGILLCLPFTYLLMKKFKTMAAYPLKGSETTSVQHYIQQQRDQLHDILQFKIRYEVVLVPLICAVGIAVPIGIYMPGGLPANLGFAGALYVLALGVCFFTQRHENQKSFGEPLHRLDGVLEEYSKTDQA